MDGDRRRCRHYVSSNAFQDDFFCPDCKVNFTTRGRKRTKYHLAQIGEVPKKVKQDAHNAVHLMEAFPQSSSSTVEGPSSAAVPSRVFVLDQVKDGIAYILFRHKFLHSLASAIFVYWKRLPITGESSKCPITLETDLDGGNKMTLKDFRDLLTSYQHMKALLEMKCTTNLNLMDFYDHSGDVDEAIGSPKYRQMVKFLVQKVEFWRDGKRFVQLVEPLLKLLAVLTISGTTIGHLCRCFETTSACYEGYLSTWEGILENLNEIWGVASHPLSKLAAILDPAYLYLEDFDRIDASKRLLDFKQQYVLETDEDNYQNDVDAYLGKSSSLFNGSAMIVKDEDHPVYFWHYCGHSLPTLRRYAKKLVFMKSIPSATELKALFANERELYKHEMNAAALHVYEQCDAERLNAFLLQMGTSEAGYLEFWSKLEKANEECWDAVRGNINYYRFCWVIEPYLCDI